ncbi:MAG: hypothetical protein Kow0068_16800 [Marinilabiliales bacterium]
MFLIILSIIFNTTFAQNSQWAKSWGGIYPYDCGRAMCQDSDGNIYVAGILQGSLPDDPFHRYAIFDSDTIYIRGANDFFLAKYDSSGNKLWVKRFGSSYDNWWDQREEDATDIIYNPLTNAIYLTGSFVNSCSYGAIILHGVDAEIFIAKFDLNGNCIWAKSAGSPGIDYSSSMTISSSNNIYVAGGVMYNAMFDTIFIPHHSGFLAKYDDNGNCNG